MASRFLVGATLLGATVSACILGACQSSSESETAALDGGECRSEEGLRIYDERIDPLFRDDQPSTCNQCHLSGIDLQQYVQSTPCETYACLVQQQLVDERRPEESKILAWIKRAEPQSKLITQEVIDTEYSAFRDWVSFNARCDACATVQCPLDSDAGSFCPDEAHDAHDAVDGGAPPLEPAGCEASDLEALFVSRVYSLRGRCAPCHFNLAENAQYEAPMWVEVAPDCSTGAQRTLDNVLSGGYIDFEHPEQSLLLLKPLPESLGGVPHGGGDKFDGLDDPGYRSLLAFIQHLVACSAAPDAG